MSFINEVQIESPSSRANAMTDIGAVRIINKEIKEINNMVLVALVC